MALITDFSQIKPSLARHISLAIITTMQTSHQNQAKRPIAREWLKSDTFSEDTYEEDDNYIDENRGVVIEGRWIKNPGGTNAIAFGSLVNPVTPR